jgi:hypothetical protein
MTEDMRQELLGQIAHRRVSIDEWLRVNRPRSSRLSTVSIISSALAAVFVAGPALGGEQFTGGAADALSLDTGAPVWRFLCVLGLIASVVAAIATNLHKSQDLAARITAAESCDADLEGLQMLLRFGRISTEEAVDLCRGYLARIPHVDEPVPI